MRHVWYVCVCAAESCQRPACCIQQRCGCTRGARGVHYGQDFFFCCPENRPWFPGTMQLMRVSPRKIRLWHHGFLKHTAEPTLSPTIIKPQWISTVDWNWERGRISFNGLDTLKHFLKTKYIYTCALKGHFTPQKQRFSSRLSYCLSIEIVLLPVAKFARDVCLLSTIMEQMARGAKSAKKGTFEQASRGASFQKSRPCKTRWSTDPLLRISYRNYFLFLPRWRKACVHSQTRGSRSWQRGM